MYAEMLLIVADPAHEDHEQYRDWLPSDFNPEHFDLALVNHLLGKHGPRLKGTSTNRRR